MGIKKTNWLAEIFYWIHQVIEEADKPISLVVMVLLPFIAPLLPAILTAHSLEKFMELQSYETWIAAVSFELIGYLGMIAVVGALMRLIKNKDKDLSSALKLNFWFYLGAYIVYLITLLVSNAVLEYVNGASGTRVTVILCLTVGLSLSAGILNASRIFNRDERDDEYKVRQEKREDSLKKTALRHGINVFALGTQDAVQDANSVVQDIAFSGDWRVDESKLKKKDLLWIQNAQPHEVAQKFGISRRTAYNWKEKVDEKLGVEDER